MNEDRPINRIRELRDAQHLTVRDLAEKSGIDFNTISRMERGTQPLDIPRMQKIARALSVKASELLNDEDVELRADVHGRAIIAQLEGIPREDFPAVVASAREIARVIRNIAAQSNAAALLGDRETVSELADVWNGWTDAERAHGLEILRVSRRK